MSETRTYCVGLPVVIEVTGARVTYTVDTSEAGSAIADDDNNLYFEGDLAADVEAIETDHRERMLAQWLARRAELINLPWPLQDTDGIEFDNLCRLITATRKELGL